MFSCLPENTGPLCMSIQAVCCFVFLPLSSMLLTTCYLLYSRNTEEHLCVYFLSRHSVSRKDTQKTNTGSPQAESCVSGGRGEGRLHSVIPPELLRRGWGTVGARYLLGGRQTRADLQALWRTLRNPADSISHVAYRVLGKFGGSNRKMLKESQKLLYVVTEVQGPSVTVEFSDCKASLQLPMEKVTACVSGSVLKRLQVPL